MKVYLTCPVTRGTTRLPIVQEAKKVLEGMGLQTTIFEVGDEPEKIFKSDMAKIEAADLIVAEVSEPSHGVGFELGVAHSKQKKIILLHKKGVKLSRMLEGTKAVVVEYADTQDLNAKLVKAVSEQIA